MPRPCLLAYRVRVSLMSTERNDIVLTKVRQARRRLVLTQFGKTLNFTVFAGLLVSVLAIGAIAIVPLPEITGAIGITISSGAGPAITPSQWMTAWLSVSLVFAVVAAGLHAWWRAPSIASAAAEVDHRFGLRERLSSSLAVSDNDLARPSFAAALGDDAARGPIRCVLPISFLSAPDAPCGCPWPFYRFLRS